MLRYFLCVLFVTNAALAFEPWPQHFEPQAARAHRALHEQFARDLEAVFTKMEPPAKKRPPQPVFTIVIDPGHGGHDPGARGRNGLLEKDVVLAISKKLAQKLNQTPGMRAVLTRDQDYFVTLRGRLRLARRAHGDVFVAIHADAAFRNQAMGAAVYALSPHGATSEAARWLAQKDNYSELDDVNLASLGDHSPVLRSVLIDLAQTVTIRDSLTLGRKILTSLESITALHHRIVEQAPFVVLKSPDIPSILVETGFITNPREEQRLGNSIYQTHLASAIWAGLMQYRKTQ